MMNIQYLPVHFMITFKTEVEIDTHPLFVLRGMLGKNLRNMCCITHKNSCDHCMYHKTCAYAFIFETILPTDNRIQPGRDKASHPFAFTQNKKFERFGEKITDYDFTLTLFGNAIGYLPYIYAAIVRSGRDGLFRSRIPFTVEKLEVCGENILRDENSIKTDITPFQWQFSPENSRDKKEGDILIELHSPLRFKTAGKYGKDFDVRSFLLCLFRRMKTLCLLYGNDEEDLRYPADDIESDIVDRRLFWKDFSHYSARQRGVMELGGVIGTMKLSGRFSDFDLALLEFNQLCNAGKNTNFGLGQMSCWYHWK